MNRKGQALVEFVLILPIFMLFLFAIVDFGMILNKKNELENASVDVVNMINRGISLEEVESDYDFSIRLVEEEKYISVIVSDKVNIITPGLNRVFGNLYEVEVERKIPNV